MNDFLTDIWNDLREKRLWPIAVGLLLCLVAVPVVLAKSSEEPPPPEPVAAPPAAKTADLELEVVEGADSTGAGSSLDGFDSRDPFRPSPKVTKASKAVASSSGGASADSGPASGGSGSEPSGGTGDEPGPQPAPAPRQKTTRYEYVADVTFWDGNRRRVIKGMTKLEMLPSESVPMLIFMGVAGGGSNAVFLVDSTLRAAGEGSCSPSRSNCAFVRIGPGAEHTFTDDDGNSYTLRVDEIRRAKIGARSSGKRGSRSKLANASLGDQAQTRRFSMPFLTDLAVVGAEPPTSDEASAEAPSSDPATSR